MHLGVDKEWFKFKNTVVIIKIQPFLLMKNKSIQQTRNAVLLYTILLLSIINTVVIEKVNAVTSSSSVIPSGDHNNNKTANDNSNSTGSLGLIAASPFYESNVGKIIGQRILSTANGSPQIENSIIENRTLKGVVNVTNLRPWISTFKPPDRYAKFRQKENVRY
jgi:hypothetical protein